MGSKHFGSLTLSLAVRKLVQGCIISACLTLLIPPLLFAQGTKGNGVIAGRITGLQGQSERLLVQLLSPGDIPVGDAYTDSHGNFSFTALPSGLYFIVIEQDGYKPIRQSVMLDLPSTDPRIQVYITMEPVDKEPKPRGQIIPGSPKSHELNAQSAVKNFNPKALQEFAKGNEKQRKGDLEAATRHYQKALNLDLGFYPALNNLGAIYVRQKEFVRAKEAFNQALKLNPDDSQAYLNMGHLLYEQGAYPEAIMQLEQGLERSPRSAVGRFFLGSAYLRTGGLDKAESNLKEACTLDPSGMAPAHLQLANLYLRRGDNSSARVELESYLRVNPSDPQAAAIKKMLVKLKSN